MKRKGFTLIELLAVIIILAVIALIATPIVLNVVNEAKKQANKNSVYGLLDAAKLYYADSMLDETKKQNVNGTTNVIDIMSVTGDKPDSGKIYINNKGQTALAVVYDEVCYTKNFNDNDITESEDIENCNVTVEGANPWTTEEVTQTLNLKEGYTSYKYCTGENCTPETVATDTTTVTLPDGEKSQVCVIYVKEDGSESEKECSAPVMIDTKGPIFTGTDDTTVAIGKTLDLTSEITVTDEISQLKENNGVTFTVSPTSIDTSVAGTYEIVYTATDKAGNVTTIKRTIVVDNPVCKRATVLNTVGTTTYGNQEVTDGVLTSGDAFDCDVDGDGTYDPATERFYYVRDLYNTSTSSFDNTYAVLVYNSNINTDSEGNIVQDNSSSCLIEYSTNNYSFYGPTTAMTKLPTTSQWSNVSLSQEHIYFNGYVARFLTLNEVTDVCNVADAAVNGLTDDCKYLSENAQTYGYWLRENRGGYWAYAVIGNKVDGSENHDDRAFGVRPVIDVKKTLINY